MLVGSKVLQDYEFTLLQDSQDIDAVYEFFGIENDGKFGCLFVEVVDGDYGRIYGCSSFMPVFSAIVVNFRTWYRLKRVGK